MAFLNTFRRCEVSMKSKLLVRSSIPSRVGGSPSELYDAIDNAGLKIISISRLKYRRVERQIFAVGSNPKKSYLLAEYSVHLWPIRTLHGRRFRSRRTTERIGYRVTS